MLLSVSSFPPVSLSELKFGRSWFQVVTYDVLRFLARGVMPGVMRFRVHGRENYPTTGGALICSNHQSFFDPVLVGLTCNRRMNYVARKTLFDVIGLRQLISFLDAIPVERDGIGLSGLKETLKRLKRGELVLIFPEGTRTRDGDMSRLLPGFCTLARRGKVPIVPIGFDGAYDAWPRMRWLPGWARVSVFIGEPIWPDEFRGWEDAELLAEVERRMRTCFEAARRERHA
jgi:1-acyl-sn-glycerol-3-phosphate acyltransferase